MNTVHELENQLKELAGQIPSDIFCTETSEQYDRMLDIKHTLHDKLKAWAEILNKEFIGTYPEHVKLRTQLSKMQIAFNKFVDKQARYEQLNDPIARMAAIANQSPHKMHKNAMIEFHILDGKNRKAE